MSPPVPREGKKEGKNLGRGKKERGKIPGGEKSEQRGKIKTEAKNRNGGEKSEQRGKIPGGEKVEREGKKSLEGKNRRGKN